MPHHRGDRAVAQCRDQPQRVSDRVEQPKAREVSIVIGVPPGGPPIATLVGRDDVEPRRGKRQHHLAPRIGYLRKAVQQQDEGSARSVEAGLQQVHSQAIDFGHKARAYAGRKNAGFQRFHLQGSKSGHVA